VMASDEQITGRRRRRRRGRRRPSDTVTPPVNRAVEEDGP
jgi:hypothetical protein